VTTTEATRTSSPELASGYRVRRDIALFAIFAALGFSLLAVQLFGGLCF
jgi:hypothetical protein